MKILAVDPGSSLIGLAILEDGVFLTGELLEPVTNEKSTFNQKASQILWQAVGAFRFIITSCEITHVAWEIVPAFGQMAQRDKIVAVVNGVKTLTFIHGLSWCEQSPVAVKKAATGNPKASKQDMKLKALELFPDMGKFKGFDVYDAALIGYTAWQKDKWTTGDEILNLVGAV